MKIIGVYKITNTVTGDFYIGSSKNVKQRWASQKCQSVWNNHPNKQLYQDMRKYGTNKFEFEVLAEVEEDKLKEMEQQFIETLKPTYNNRNSKGWDIERRKEYNKEYQQSDKYKEYQKEFYKEYNNQLCCYNGEVLKLIALSTRFRRSGIPHPTAEAKKYLLKREQINDIEFYDIFLNHPNY